MFVLFIIFTWSNHCHQFSYKSINKIWIAAFLNIYYLRYKMKVLFLLLLLKWLRLIMKKKYK
jgi:hypothetical protein